MSYTVREARASDIPSLASLERECFSSPWSEDAFRDSMNAENTVFLLCEDESGEAIGYVGCVLVLDECSITDICTAQHARGKGVGYTLMRALEHECNERGVREIFLEVRESNGIAKRLYERCGYKRCGTRRNFYTAPREDAAIYTLCTDADKAAE